MQFQQVYCSICNNLTRIDPCAFCLSTARDRTRICVIEENFDLCAVEETQNYYGLYHILHGSLSPVRGVSPDDLKLANLLPRLMPNGNEGVEVAEIIVVVKSTVESKATANYIARLLKPIGIAVREIEIESAKIVQVETVQ